MARHNKLKLGPEYYGLDSEGKVLYHIGLPLRYIKSEPMQFYFNNEPLPSGKILSAQDQGVVFNEFYKNPVVDQGLTVFNSHPTDSDAMEAVGSLLKYYVNQLRFDNIEFVHPTEQIPQDPDDRADIYILTGVHYKDPMIMPHVRRWVNYPTGCQIWLVSNAPKAFSWCVDELGKKPDALFSFQKAVIQVG